MQPKNALILALVVLAPAAAVGQEGALPPEPAAITQAKAQGLLLVRDPVWTSSRLPLNDYRIFPARALRLERNGEIRLRCKVVAAGQIGACAVLREDSPGIGYGEAAANAAKFFTTVPTIRVANPENGQPIEISTEGVVVEFDFEFQIDGPVGPLGWTRRAR